MGGGQRGSGREAERGVCNVCNMCILTHMQSPDGEMRLTASSPPLPLPANLRQRASSLQAQGARARPNNQ